MPHPDAQHVTPDAGQAFECPVMRSGVTRAKMASSGVSSTPSRAYPRRCSGIGTTPRRWVAAPGQFNPAQSRLSGERIRLTALDLHDRLRLDQRRATVPDRPPQRRALEQHLGLHRVPPGVIGTVTRQVASWTRPRTVASPARRRSTARRLRRAPHFVPWNSIGVTMMP